MKSYKILVIFIFLFSINSPTVADSENRNNISCLDSISNASKLNAYELWKGSIDCKKSNKNAESAFLLIVGQVRATTDMQVLDSASDEDDIKKSELWGQLYFYFGGSGGAEIHRNPNAKKRFLELLEGWSAKLDNDYSPGWSYKADLDSAFYEQMLICQKVIRLNKLKWYSELINNDAYFNASKQINNIQSNNSTPISIESEDYTKITALHEEMSKIASKLPPLNDELKECEFLKNYEPATDSDITHLYDGYNGPRSGRAETFDSKEKVFNSWIAKSLTEEQLQNIVSKIDFNKKILVSLSFGKRTNVTGNTYISDVDYNSVLESLSIAGMIGVNISDCKEPKKDSYPFVIASAPRPEKLPDNPSTFMQNFPDGCKPVKSGEHSSK